MTRFFPFFTLPILTGSIFPPAPWDATDTQLSYLKTDRGMQKIPTPSQASDATDTWPLYEK
jgi:hypothetical protein